MRNKNTVKQLQNYLLQMGARLPKFGADGDLGGETKAAIDSLEVPEYVKIALKEVGIYEIVGKLHSARVLEYQATTAGKYTDDETPWCLEGDIEVLTSKGFVRLDQFKEADPESVAQLNPDTLQVEFVPEFFHIEKEYTGRVCDIKVGSLDITCDPNHKLFGTFSSSNKYKLREVNSLTNFGIKIPQVKSSQKGVNCSNEDLVFLAAYISDGNIKFNRVNFKFSKERKINVIEQYPYERKTVDTKIYGVSKKPYINYSFSKVLLREEFLSSTNYKHLTWEFVNNLSCEQAKVFIDAYGHFDGTPSEGGGFEVFTEYKELQEQLNYIATMAGYKSTPFSIKQVSPNSKIEYLHHVYVSMNKHRCFNKKHVVEKDFSGKLYCLSVPSSIMIIRCRNGVIIPIGNCGAFISWVMKQAGINHGIKIPERAKEWIKFGYAVDEPTVGSIAVKSRVGGGHVCIVVGKRKDGKLLCVGGNQNNEVNIAAYDKSVFESFRNHDKRQIVLSTIDITSNSKVTEA